MKKPIVILLILWAISSNAQTPYMVKDVQAVNWTYTERLLINNKWYFGLDNKLWVTDGTTAGTILLKTFGGTDTYTYHELNNKLLLFADDDNNGSYELWTSDGTTGGTTLVKDVQAVNWTYTERLLINNKWYFGLDNKLWVTDGTTAGTILLKTFGSTDTYTYHELTNKLLLFADDNNNGSYELWTSDGTTGGTTMVKDVQAVNWTYTERLLINNKWYFGLGNKLWVTDGTTAGTILLKTFGSTDTYTYHELNNKLLLFADDNNNGSYELWISDGTTIGTTLVKDVQAVNWNNSERLLINNKWYFGLGNKLWVTDGTTAGTILLKTFGGTATYTYHELNNKLLLFANDNGINGYELWTSDGTPGGTTLVKDVQAVNWSNTERLLINNKWYFGLSNKLWVTDGTTAGTLLLKTFGGTDTYTYHELNNKLLLFANDNGINGYELWTSDGTTGGTTLVKDVQAANWNTIDRILINNQWFFAVDNNELWVTNGTTAGTTLLKTFGGNSVYTFHSLPNQLLLFADDNSNTTYELWGANIPVGINEVTEPDESFINVYPNPCRNYFTITINEKQQPIQEQQQYLFSLYKPSGEVVYKQRLGHGKQVLSFNLPSGLYVYTVMNKKNKIAGNGKLIVQ